MPDQHYQNESSQSERRKVLENDQQVRNTYLSHTESFIDDDRGGRFAAIEKSATVIGTSPVVYPQLPSDAPANQAAMVPDEPLIDGTGEGNVLGYRVDDMGLGSAAPDSQLSGQDTAGDASTPRNASLGTVEVGEGPATAALSVAAGPSRLRRRM